MVRSRLEGAMRMRMKQKARDWLIILAVIFGSPLYTLGSDNTSSFFVDGNELVRMMQAYDKQLSGQTSTFDASMSIDSEGFRAFVMGVNDTKRNKMCPGPGVTVGQTFAIVGKYLNSNPERWNKPAADQVVLALRNAFPCNGDKQGFGYFKEGNSFVNDMKASESVKGSQHMDLSDFYNRIIPSIDFSYFIEGVCDARRDDLCLPIIPKQQSERMVVVQQIEAVIKQFVNDHPEQWNQPAADLVFAGLKNGFSCTPAHKN